MQAKIKPNLENCPVHRADKRQKKNLLVLDSFKTEFRFCSVFQQP